MIFSAFDRVENIVGKGEKAGYQYFLLFPQCFEMASFPDTSKGVIVWEWVKPLPDMPILGSPNSAADKDMMAKIWTNRDTIVCLSRKNWKKEKLLGTSNFSFSHNVFGSSLLMMN